MMFVSSFTECSVCCRQRYQGLCFFFSCCSQCIKISSIVLLPGRNVVMVFSSTVIVVPDLVIGKLLSSWLVPTDPVGHLFPVAASIMFLSLASRPLFCRKNQANTSSGKRGGASSLSVFRCMCAISTWTKHWNLHQSIRPIPSLLPSDTRTNSIPDLPVVRNKIVEVLTLPLTQYVAALPKLV